MATFGTRLKELREEARLTQEQLAEEIGVKKNTVYRWETGEYRPSDENALLVAHYLKVNGDFYEIRKGKFVSQEPAYRMLEEHGNLKFLDNDDNFVMYSGKP